jgi:hypothetical protein
MSRLDDELKIAFKREEPSMDFAARVLERINEAPAPEKSWWHKLSALFDQPKLRLVAVGVAAALIVAIGAAQYLRLQHKPVQEDSSIVAATRAPETGETGRDETGGARKDEEVAAPVRPKDIAPKRIIHRRGAAAGSAKTQSGLAGLGKDRPVSAEAEAAKERVLFALQIVGSTLSDAQRVIQEDSPKFKPEPLHNR